MARQMIHRSKKHPTSQGAAIRDLMERKSPAPDFLLEPLHPIVTFEYHADTDTDTDTDVEMLTWQETLDAEFPMVMEYTVQTNEIDDGHELGYSTDLTLSEINEVGGFIVTRHKFYC